MVATFRASTMLLLLAGCATDTDATEDAGCDPARGPKREYPEEATLCTSRAECRLETKYENGGGCGSITRDNVIAVRREWSFPRPERGGCGRICLAPPPDPQLFAGCEAGRCGVLDIAYVGWTGCTTDAECGLAPRSCCPCGGVGYTELVGIRAGLEAALHTFLCDGPPACDCAYFVDPLFVPICREGECQVGYAGP